MFINLGFVLDPLIGGALVSAGASFINGIIGNNSQEKMMGKQAALNYQYNKMLMEDQFGLNQASLAQSPSSMVAGLRSAGLNPAMVNGQPSAPQVSGSSIGSPNAVPQMSPLDYAQFISIMADAQLKKNQADKEKTETDLNEIEKLYRAEALKAGISVQQMQALVNKANADNIDLNTKLGRATFRNKVLHEKLLNDKEMASIEQIEQSVRTLQSEENLNNAKSAATVEEIAQNWAKIDVMVESNNIRRDELQETFRHNLRMEGIEQQRANTEQKYYDKLGTTEQVKVQHYMADISRIQAEASKLSSDAEFRKAEATLKQIEADVQKSMPDWYLKGSKILDDALGKAGQALEIYKNYQTGGFMKRSGRPDPHPTTKVQKTPIITTTGMSPDDIRTIQRYGH